MTNRDDLVQRGTRQTDGNDLSLAQIARAGVMIFGFAIMMIGIVLFVSLFNAVYHVIFDDANNLEEIFHKWRAMIVPKEMEPGHYDKIFPTTTVLTFVALFVPVLFLSALAGKILTIGAKVARLKD